MVNVDTTLKDLNQYMKKPLSVKQLEDSLTTLGYELDSNNPDALKIDITADRPDMISPAGIARVLNHFLGYDKGFPKMSAKESDYKIIVDTSVQPIRPFTAAMVVKNIHLTQEKLDELIWVQEKIHATFARERKKAAIGIYPLKKITWPITFTGEKPDAIHFTPLGHSVPLTGRAILSQHDAGKKYGHLLADFPHYPVFRDAKKKVLSMPPIINSQETGSVELTDTQLFVEVSGHYWPTLSIILDMLAYMFSDMKGDVYSVAVTYPNQNTPRLTPELGTPSQTIEIAYVNRVLGTSFTSKQVGELLERMMYDVVKSNEKQLVVEFPAFRADVLHPIDVVDDVARAYGFDNLKPETVTLFTTGAILPQTRLNEDLREALVGLGFQEVMTFLLTSHEHHFTAFEREETPHVKLGVVKEQGLTMVRNMLYPETMRALLNNRSATQPFKLFELDQIVDIHKPSDTGTQTHYKLCLILGHASAGFDEMKGYIEQLSRVLGKIPEYTEIQMNGFIVGRTSHVQLGEIHGFFGEMHPSVLERLSIPFPCVVFECYIKMEK